MDILNQLSSRRFRQVHDLLAFVSMYDDSKRSHAYRLLLRSHAKFFRGVEGGCGLGLFTVELAQLGARKVYAVAHNPLLANLPASDFNASRKVFPAASNWSFVWTPRKENKISLRFRRAEAGMEMECHFGWKR